MPPANTTTFIFLHSKAIIKNCNANAKDISAKVKDDFKRYCGTAQQYDDQSLLVVKIQG